MLKKMVATSLLLGVFSFSSSSLWGQEEKASSNSQTPAATSPPASEQAAENSADNSAESSLRRPMPTTSRSYYVYPRNYAKTYGRPFYNYNLIPSFYYQGGYPRGYQMGQGWVNPNVGNSSLNYGNSWLNYGNSWLNYGNSW